MRLKLILSRCKINFQYIVVGSISPQIVVIECCTGGTRGFICSCFSVGAILFAPPTILAVYFLRSLFQQIQHNVEYNKLQNNISIFLKDKNIQEEIKKFFI